MTSPNPKPDTLTVDGDEYSVEWDGEHVVLHQNFGGICPRPSETVGICPG